MSKPSDITQVSDILQQGTAELQAVGIDEAATDAALLLGHCLDKSTTELYLAGKDRLDQKQKDQFFTLLARRKEREPVAYILGKREFWSLSFSVSPAVLIPRPETEFLVETALSKRNLHGPQCRSLDLCCGSGAIAVVLARECETPVIGVDISAASLKVAKENCRKHDVTDLVSLVQADLGTCFLDAGFFSLIVSNPPYVRSAEIDRHLQPEVALFEPRKALDGGSSGLDFIIGIREVLPKLLAPGGDIFMEIGDQQGTQVRNLFLKHKSSQEYQFVTLFQDYSGRDRVVHIRKNE